MSGQAASNSKYVSYPDYKDSGVEWLGDVPVNWGVFQGKRVFMNRKESALSDDAQLAASQAYGVIPQSLLIELTGSKVMLALKGTDSFRHVSENDFVISLRSFEGGIEHSAYIGCVSPAYTVLSAVIPIHPWFYRYLLKCKPYVSALQASTDSLRDGKSITFEQFGSIRLPAPPLEEQRTIAAFLDYETARIDSLIDKQQQLIELLKEKRQAVISHAVTKGLTPDAPMKDSGVEWLGQVPEHWRVGRIGYYCRVENGTTPSKANLDYWTEGTVPWLSSGAVNQYEVREASEMITADALAECSLRLLPKDTLVVGMIGQGKTRGMSAITRIEATINQNLAAVIPNDQLDSEFLHFVFQAAYRALRETGRGGNQAALNCELLANLRFAKPELVAQKEIVQRLKVEYKKYDHLVSRAQSGIELLQERRIALISAAVTGKIDLRGWTNPTEGSE
ncbi:restriction endonuclease subunit S [Shewanella algae]|uniref:restriction endonuclease subunit S n=1 Tax=Shewanella algae TaxID=38313 RepID=UPI0031F4D3BA